MAEFTPTQGRYLSFIQAYIERHGGPPAESELDDLHLEPDRVFGYWFDFGDDWYHQVRMERIERAIPTVTYPRVIKRVGKSPPQYSDD